jgi:Beta-propeller repeat
MTTTERKRKIITFVGTSRVLALILLLCALLVPGANRGAAQHAPYSTAGVGLRHASGYGTLPLRFEPNVGQADPSVLYLAHGAGYTLFLTRTGAVLSLVTFHPSGTNLHRRTLNSAGSPRATLRLSFSGANASPRLQPEQKASGIVNYFLGNNPKRWYTNVPTYARVVYHHLYPGIDLVFYGTNGRLEYDWLVHPHARPDAIAMTIQGANTVRIGPGGTLHLTTPAGVIEQRPPSIYQPAGGKRARGVLTPARWVAGEYRILSRNRVGFHLDAYDRSRPLIIDPVLAYSTYFGTGGSVYANGIAVDGSGSAYITGAAEAGGTILTRNPYQSASGGLEDGFVAKLNASGSDLVYSTYIGGKGDDSANAIAVDGSGNAYIAGDTTSTDFPGVPPQATPSFQAFVIKLSAAGNTLIYSKVDRDSKTSYGYGIAVDSTEHAYYTGSGSGDGHLFSVFITKLDTTGTVMGGYSAGTGSTNGNAIALDGLGHVYVAGDTNDFDLSSPGALRPIWGGKQDAFLMKLDTATISPIYTTFLGGAEDDFAYAVATDPSGNVYVGGYTMSANFPLSSALQIALKGKEDAFITKLTPSGNSYVYSTYLGGQETSYDEIYGIAADAAGNAFVTGYTDAPDFPVVNALPGLTGIRGGEDAFVAEVAADGQSLVYSSFLGGSKADGGSGIALDGNGNAYVAGFTDSEDFPTTGSAYQPGLIGTEDAFVSKIGAPLPPTPTPTSTVQPSPTATATGIRPTSTSTPTATSTLVATATATSTPTRIPTPTHTPVPPAKTPHISLNSSRITSGNKLKVTVITSPSAEVTITVQAKSGKALLFRAISTGRADGAGKLTKNIKITYNPDKQVKARVIVEAKTAGGSTVNSTNVTILHHP